MANFHFNQASAPPDAKTLTHIDLINEEAWNIRRSEAARSKTLASDAFATASLCHYAKGMAEADLTLTMHDCYKEPTEACLSRILRALEQFEIAIYPVGQVRALNMLGYYYIIHNQLSLAFEYLLKGLALAEQHHIDDMIVFFYYNIGEIYKNTLKLYQEALSYLLRALPYVESVLHPLTGAIYASIAVCYQYMGQGSESRLYRERALQSAEVIDDYHTLGICYHMLAIAAKDQKDFLSAQKFIDLERLMNSRTEDSYSIVNAALIQAQLAFDQKDYKEALRISIEALELVETKGYKALAYHFYWLLAKGYEQLSHFQQAANYYNQYTQAYQDTLTNEVESRISILTTELRFEEAKKAYEVKNKNDKLMALTDLVTGVAHEINTPLGTAITLTSFLSEQLNECQVHMNAKKLTSEQLEEFLSISTESTHLLHLSLNRTASIVENFKSVAMDHHALELSEICLKELLEDVVISVQPLLKETAVHIHIDCDPQLSIISYERLLFHVIQHLIQNALLHAFDAPSTGTIRLAAVPGLYTISLICEDNGKGIPADDLDRVFNPFFTTKKANGGIGLGLNIVYNMVTQLLNGRIEVISQQAPSTSETLEPCGKSGAAASGRTRFEIKIPKK